MNVGCVYVRDDFVTSQLFWKLILVQYVANTGVMWKLEPTAHTHRDIYLYVQQFNSKRKYLYNYRGRNGHFEQRILILHACKTCLNGMFRFGSYFIVFAAHYRYLRTHSGDITHISGAFTVGLPPNKVF